MPKIRFTETRTVQDGTGTTFVAGKAYLLPEDSCIRWKRRNIAVDAGANAAVSLPMIFNEFGAIVEQEEPPAPVVQPAPAVHQPAPVVPPVGEGEDGDKLKGEGENGTKDLVEIPEGWDKLHHASRKKLAKLISGEDAATTEEADDVVKAELERRAAAANAKDGEGEREDSEREADEGEDD